MNGRDHRFEACFADTSEEEELIADVFAEDIEDAGLDVPDFLR